MRFSSRRGAFPRGMHEAPHIGGISLIQEYFMKKSLICFVALIALMTSSGCDILDDYSRRSPGDEGNGVAESSDPDGDDDRASGKPSLPQPRKKWTVLVYLDGDNNLSPYSDLDVNEMKKSGSNKNFNIVILWDNDPAQNSGSRTNRHGYYYVTPGSTELLKDAGEVDMGAAGTAKNFVDFATQNFPAERYMWIFWNHGGAVDRLMKGVCWDDTNGGNHLSETDQKEIVKYLGGKIGKKVDIVGYDACLMGTAELAYQLREHADYMIASQQTVPGDGWDYNFLAKIKSSPSMSARTLSGHVVAYFKKYYDGRGESDATLAAYNLKYADRLASAMDAFCEAAMASDAGSDSFKDLAQGLDVFGAYACGGGDCYYTKDLFAYFDRVADSSTIPTAVRKKASAVCKAAKSSSFIFSEWHGKAWNNKAHGLSITLKSATSVYKKLDLCRDTHWDEFLNWAGFANSDYVY
jgi:hypothetical protein